MPDDAAKCLTLADLIDIEYQFALDSDQDEQVLRTRYRQIGQSLDAQTKNMDLTAPRAGLLTQSPSDVRRLLGHWIRQMRSQSRELPGVAVVRTLGRLQLLLFAVGFLAGGAVCKGVLAYDGTTPINVIHFINVFVFFQVALFVYLLIALLTRSKLLSVSRQHVQALGPVYEALKAWIYRGKSAAPVNRDGKAVVLFTAINRVDRYRAPVERWRLVLLTQLFGVGFNLGAVLAFINLVTFTDLAFSWSTTLNMSSQTYESLIRGLALPWSWALPDAVPSLFAIEHTQYLRLDQRYVLPFAAPGDEHAAYRFTSADAIRSWWPFLLAALVFYGLLPRLFMAVFAAANARRYLRQARFDTPEVARLIGWMARPAYAWASPEAEQAAPEKSVPAAEGRAGGAAALAARGGSLVVVTLGNLPVPPESVASQVRQVTGVGVAAVHAYEGAAAQFGQLSQTILSLSKSGPVSLLLIAEGFEAPTQEMRSLITQCQAVLPDLWVFVAAVSVSGTESGPKMVPAAGDEAAMWEGAVKNMRDPRLLYLTFSPDGGLL